MSELNKHSNYLLGRDYGILDTVEKELVDRYIEDLHNPKWVRLIIDRYDTGYQISNTGQIINSSGMKVPQYRTSKFSYPTAMLIIHDISMKFYVHRLVAVCFLPNTNQNNTVSHLNGLQYCNWVGNLYWEQVEKPYYTKEEVLSALELLRDPNISYGSIYQFTGVTSSALYNIYIGKSYKDISEGYEIPKRKVKYVNPITPAGCKPKVSPERIHEVCRLLRDTTNSFRGISSITGVDSRTIRDIARGRIWKSISREYGIPFDRTVTPKKRNLKPKTEAVLNWIDEDKDFEYMIEHLQSEFEMTKRRAKEFIKWVQEYFIDDHS